MTKDSCPLGSHSQILVFKKEKKKKPTLIANVNNKESTTETPSKN